MPDAVLSPPTIERRVTPDKVEAVPPVEVAVIGGAGVTPLLSGTTATTPGHQPNIIITVVTPLMAVAIRFVNVYIGNLVGLLTAAIATNVITASDFRHLVIKCASAALAGAVVLSLKDVVTVLSGLEKRYPLATGSV